MTTPLLSSFRNEEWEMDILSLQFEGEREKEEDYATNDPSPSLSCEPTCRSNKSRKLCSTLACHLLQFFLMKGKVADEGQMKTIPK